MGKPKLTDQGGRTLPLKDGSVELHFGDLSLHRFSCGPGVLFRSAARLWAVAHFGPRKSPKVGTQKQTLCLFFPTPFSSKGRIIG